MVMKIFYLIVAIIFVFFSGYILKSLKNGVFESFYGENMTVRKSEGSVGFYFTLLLDVLVWVFLLYILISRYDQLFKSF